MRKRIRLTGRRQLPSSCVRVNITTAEDGKRTVGLTLADPNAFKGFPADARVRLRLNENKLSDVLEFGTVGALRISALLDNNFFSAPSCQVRVVTSSGAKPGLLLG